MHRKLKSKPISAGNRQSESEFKGPQHPLAVTSQQVQSSQNLLNQVDFFPQKADGVTANNLKSPRNCTGAPLGTTLKRRTFQLINNKSQAVQDAQVSLATNHSSMKSLEKSQILNLFVKGKQATVKNIKLNQNAVKRVSKIVMSLELKKQRPQSAHSIVSHASFTESQYLLRHRQSNSTLAQNSGSASRRVMTETYQSRTNTQSSDGVGKSLFSNTALQYYAIDAHASVRPQQFYQNWHIRTQSDICKTQQVEQEGSIAANFKEQSKQSLHQRAQSVADTYAQALGPASGAEYEKEGYQIKLELSNFQKSGYATPVSNTERCGDSLVSANQNLYLIDKKREFQTQTQHLLKRQILLDSMNQQHLALKNASQRLQVKNYLEGLAFKKSNAFEEYMCLSNRSPKSTAALLKSQRLRLSKYSCKFGQLLQKSAIAQKLSSEELTMLKSLNSNTIEF